MNDVYVDGILVPKQDGQCAHPSCEDVVDFHKWDKPPAGWATLTLNRYVKTGGYSGKTFLLCPKHTINFLDRQPTLTQKAKKWVKTIVESPFAGNVEKNLAFLRAIMRSCLLNGEAPYASHGLYTQPGVLDDTKPEERRLGMEAGFAWSEVAQKINVYSNYGLSDGMLKGIERHKSNGKIVEVKLLEGWEVTETRGIEHDDERK